jgi:hypothetical protein
VWRARRTSSSKAISRSMLAVLVAFGLAALTPCRAFGDDGKSSTILGLGAPGEDPAFVLILPPGNLRVSEYASVLREGRMLCRLKLAPNQPVFICIFGQEADPAPGGSKMPVLLNSKLISVALESGGAEGDPISTDWHSERELSVLSVTGAGVPPTLAAVSKSRNLESAEWLDLSEIVFSVSLPRSRQEADLETRLQREGGDVSLDELCSILKAGTVIVSTRRLDVFEAARSVQFPRTTVGRTEFVKGNPEAVDPSGTVRPLMVGSPVYQTDRLVCSSASKLSVEFSDGTVLWLGESSELTVDAYAFRRDKPSLTSAGLRFIKGVCRVVTGAITKLNPDRFRVRMRMASIGIRGCETGFRSTDVRNDVYILEIGKEETVVVAATVDGGDFDSVYVHDLSRKKEEDPKIKIIEMDQSGAGVSIIAKKGPTLVELDRTDVQFFRDSTSHMPAARFEMDQKPGQADVMIRPAEEQASENQAQ